VNALAEHHRLMLEQASAIDPAVIAERSYWTAQGPKDLLGLGFKAYQIPNSRFPALVIPHHDPSGEDTYSVLRPDHPRTTRAGRIVKYEQPADVGLRLDVPPRCVEGLRDPSQRPWWTEGAKKADALASRGLVAVNTPGVDGWRSPTAIADLFGIPLKGRQVVIAYDSDVLTKLAVAHAVAALAAWMKQKDALVMVLNWSRLI
jgi:hypothetical protein